MTEITLNQPVKSERGTASNRYISQYYQLAEEKGLDADALLHQAGLSPDIIDKPEERVAAEKLATVLVNIWDALQDETAACSPVPIPRGSFYMMGKLTIHEQNLGKSLEQARRFYTMVTSAFTMDIRVDAEQVLFSCQMHYPDEDPDHLFAEINLMSWHRYSSWLIAENIPLSEVFFSYPEPAEVSEYSYLFPGKHVFNAPYMGFAFHRKYLDRETVQNAASLKTFMRACPVLLFLQPKTDFSLSGELQQILKKGVPDGFPTIEEAADQLHMTKRTLTRKLKDEGTSFQKIKDLIRRDRAIYYLTRQPLSVGKVAEKVGFSDPAVFARAFRVWTGLSPRDYRAKHAHSEQS
ncbi:AraC family transcriptional regulator [Pseudomaricurvus alkylphenolicus]|uniref:AraC family transcriptional regulator n=1 Tax=Pseudomaricurvus alkylphenolicus TaxID=1306991 RepID=UPI001422C733|nr:AraC family transcriptional regulator [Pseudomaricurvus alkylphenolicus]NIB43374.1 AraC family transcriptional regulator [Pseudomaricurvus alkylphenolicus]